MSNDSFTDFISQSGIINLILAVIFLGFVWVTFFVLAVQRSNERRRRKRAGEPPLPNIFVQFYNIFKNFSQQGVPSSSSATSQDEMLMPSLDDLTEKLPEPDLASMFMTPPKEEAATYSMPAELPISELSEPVSSDIPKDTTSSSAAPIEDIPVAEPPQRAGATYVAGSNEIPEDAVEIMRVWRDVTEGVLIIQMGQRIFQTIPELGDRTFARRFIAVVEELGRTAQAGALSIGLPAPNFQKRTAVFSQQGDWANQSKPVAPPLVTASEAITPVQPTPKVGSIADQIEELLQFRLMQSPIYQQRSIHVRSNPDGSLRIEVDGRSYAEVEDVIDPDIRDFIRNVIREWEARQ
ncbi:MAG: hypothetical protein CUN55_10815 [Phototrophicales bacterium]|nr:MAG: hypothetical protein CUN55_10815 [Phototrophicales bacterium]